MCCGQKRNAIKADGAPDASAVKLLYRGSAPIQIRGNHTGFLYDFPRAYTVKPVDPRDAAMIVQTRMFRQVQ